MGADLRLTLNGRERTIAGTPTPSPMTAVLAALELRADRVAVEVNGELAQRESWPDLQVHSGDRLEIVHFVGGGGTR